MAKRSKERDKAKQLYIEHSGDIDVKDIAKAVGKSIAQIRKWKSLDKWDKYLPKKKRGGQPNNDNALGGGAPTKNKNAEKHGAYSSVYLEDLSDDERRRIERITLDAKLNMIRELQLLTLKEDDLRRRINAYKEDDTNTYLDKRVIVKQVKDEENSELTSNDKPAQTVTEVRVSAFSRISTLETQLDKTNGRIIKLIDTIKGYELEHKKLDLEERKHNLNKQRASGEYQFDPELGEIIDDNID